jgi:DNA-binding SARP family transcriptional activator
VADVRLSLIGGFELRCDGEPSSVQFSSQRLVAYLALRGRPLLRVHVAGALWTDSSEERACANLRSALWRLRERAGAVVEANATHVWLSPAADVDVRGVAALAQRLLEQPEGTDVLRAEILQLNGDLLPGWYDDWVLHERERVRQLCIHALERVASRETTQGRFSHAIDTALRAIQADPLRESAHRILINAYLAEGNAGSGVRQYHAFRRRVVEELGLEPSPQLTKMFADLAYGAP